jgi:hypothetical protein
MPTPKPAGAQLSLPSFRLQPATALSLGMAETAASHAIGMVLYSAAQTEQAGQQMVLATLGTILTLIVASGQKAVSG